MSLGCMPFAFITPRSPSSEVRRCSQLCHAASHEDREEFTSRPHQNRRCTNQDTFGTRSTRNVSWLTPVNLASTFLAHTVIGDRHACNTPQESVFVTASDLLSAESVSLAQVSPLWIVSSYSGASKT